MRVVVQRCRYCLHSCLISILLSLFLSCLRLASSVNCTMTCSNRSCSVYTSLSAPLLPRLYRCSRLYLSISLKYYSFTFLMLYTFLSSRSFVVIIWFASISNVASMLRSASVAEYTSLLTADSSRNRSAAGFHDTFFLCYIVVDGGGGVCDAGGGCCCWDGDGCWPVGGLRVSRCDVDWVLLMVSMSIAVDVMSGHGMMGCGRSIRRRNNVYVMMCCSCVFDSSLMMRRSISQYSIGRIV